MRILRSALLLALASCALAAQADLFHLTYDVDSVSVDLLLSADAIAGSPGRFHITGVSGTHGTDVVHGFSSGGPTPFSNGTFGVDNVLYATGSPTVVDDYGFSFSAGSLRYNFCTEFGTPYSEHYFDPSQGYVNPSATNVSLTAVSTVPGPVAALPFALMALKRLKRA